MPKIIEMGPHNAKSFYHDSTTIAVEYFKLFKVESTLYRGLVKVPKNTTKVKIKIVDIILSLRKLKGDTNKPDQTHLFKNSTYYMGN